jgi:hypothetical protein
LVDGAWRLRPAVRRPVGHPGEVEGRPPELDGYAHRARLARRRPAAADRRGGDDPAMQPSGSPERAPAAVEPATPTHAEPTPAGADPVPPQGRLRRSLAQAWRQRLHRPACATPGAQQRWRSEPPPRSPVGAEVQRRRDEPQRRKSDSARLGQPAIAAVEAAAAQRRKRSDRPAERRGPRGDRSTCDGAARSGGRRWGARVRVRRRPGAAAVGSGGGSSERADGPARRRGRLRECPIRDRRWRAAGRWSRSSWC